MKPESNSRRLFAITRAKGKMYEFRIPETSHLQIPGHDEPASLLLLAVGILGDYAFNINVDGSNSDIERRNLEFAAAYFDALLESQLENDVGQDTSLLAAAAYYLADRPGSSRVMADRHKSAPPQTPMEGLLRWLLCGEYESWDPSAGPYAMDIDYLAQIIRLHFLEGGEQQVVLHAAIRLRDLAYRDRASRELLFADLILAVVRRKLEFSSWLQLPVLSGLPIDDWRPAIASGKLPQELWPAQLEIGRAGIFRGRSGVVQMPTSAGKTRSVEMILRSGFLSGRVKLAVVVVPFRALSHEIALSLSDAFKNDSDVRINELSDALQMDFDFEFDGILADFFGTANQTNILVVTPEKFLFIVRQRHDLLTRVDLLIYDEAHQFDSGQRGVTYELLLTETRAALKSETQIVALSAVIRNASDLGSWLLGDHEAVVDGSRLMPTARATAFAGQLEKRGQLHFFESNDYSVPDYFVPRIIEEYQLELQRQERRKRYFPDRNKENHVGDVALQIGFRLVSEGPVAIFSGRKASASKLARRAVEVFERGLELTRPVEASDITETGRLSNLIELHFGGSHDLYKAANLGIFIHHGNTPNGLRVSIEHAMQNDLVRFVICTSTLAQGVNLPIRYLIVTGTWQGESQMKVRDFQNLLGRAGRAGMHTEGMVIFADPRIYGAGHRLSTEFRDTVRLLDPDNAEDTSSSLLNIVQPTGSLSPFSAVQIAALVSREDYLETNYHMLTPEMQKEIQNRRRLLSAVESYLMANRRDDSGLDFGSLASRLCEQTFAFSLASEEEREGLRYLFVSTAETVDALLVDEQQRETFGQTLLNARKTREVYDWVEQNQQELVNAHDNDELLDIIWPLCMSVMRDGFMHQVEPQESAYSMTRAWTKGENYEHIVQLARDLQASKPHGKSRRRINESDVLQFLENEVSFELSLIISAVCQFIGDEYAGDGTPLDNLLKSIKYGVSTQAAIFIYEAGFSDRAVATLLSEQLDREIPEWTDIRASLVAHREFFRSVLRELPGYFLQVLDTLVDEDNR